MKLMGSLVILASNIIFDGENNMDVSMLYRHFERVTKSSFLIKTHQYDDFIRTIHNNNFIRTYFPDDGVLLFMPPESSGSSYSANHRKILSSKRSYNQIEYVWANHKYDPESKAGERSQLSSHEACLNYLKDTPKMSKALKSMCSYKEILDLAYTGKIRLKGKYSCLTTGKIERVHVDGDIPLPVPLTRKVTRHCTAYGCESFFNLNGILNIMHRDSPFSKTACPRYRYGMYGNINNLVFSQIESIFENPNSYLRDSDDSLTIGNEVPGETSSSWESSS